MLIFLIGLVASFAGATVGGVGLITIPALIFLGFPPKIAIITSVFGGLGMVGGFYKFHKSAKIDYKLGIPITIASMIGAYLGADALLSVSEDLLGKLIGLVLLVILFIVLLDRKRRGMRRRKAPGKIREYFGYLAFVLIGFWRGFVSAGFAIFATYSLVLMYRRTFLESAGTKTIVLLATAIIASIVYGMNGLLELDAGIALMLGMLMGSYAGASYGIRKGDSWVRKVFIVVVIVAALKLLV